jgi:hypothetical protein
MLKNACVQFAFNNKLYQMNAQGYCYCTYEDITVKTWQRTIRISYSDFESARCQKYNY